MPSAGLTLAALAPTIPQPQLVQVPVGALNLAANVPTIMATNHKVSVVPVAAINLASAAPTILAGSGTVTVSDQAPSDSVLSGSTAFIEVRVKRNGNIAMQQGVLGSSTDVGDPDWILPRSSTVGDGYEVMLTINSGPTPDGGSSANGSWIAITTDRAWSWSRTSVGSSFIDATISIRAVGGSTLDTGLISGDLNVDP